MPYVPLINAGNMGVITRSGRDSIVIDSVPM